MPALDLVLPCYNPSAGWPDVILNNVALLNQLLPETEIFVYLVNDGSSIGIRPEDIQHLEATLPRFTYLRYTPNRGKGFALRQGIQACRHQYCIYTDVDFPYYPEDLAAVYAALRAGNTDVVAGIRDAQYYCNVPGFRAGLSRLLKLFNKRLLRLPVTDTQCGLKGFNATGRAIILKTRIDRYLFDLEFMVRAGKKPGFRLSQVQVKLRPGISFRPLNLFLLVSECRSLFRCVC